MYAYESGKRDDEHRASQRSSQRSITSYHDDYSPFHSPPSCLIAHSPNTPIMQHHPFGSYHTFDSGHGDQTDPEYSQTSSKQTSNHREDAPLMLRFKQSYSHQPHEQNHIGQLQLDPIYAHIQAAGNNGHKNEHNEDGEEYYGREEEYSSCDDVEDGDELYTEFGRKYRQFCFSNAGIKFTIFLNVMMVIINSSLIIYEVVVMINAHSFTTYYDAQLPFIYSIFDILLTLILLVEISLHLTAIYKCHVCNYFKYSHDHKIDILVFFLSLFLCILYVCDAFGIGDMDNISFLALRMIRDVMRFVRCVIFAKFLYDSIVQLHSPQKQRQKRRRKISMSSTSCSSGWDQLKTHKQHEFVCL